MDGLTDKLPPAATRQGSDGEWVKTNLLPPRWVVFIRGDQVRLRTWFAGARVVNVSDGGLATIQIPSKVRADWLNLNYRAETLGALWREGYEQVTDVLFIERGEGNGSKAEEEGSEPVRCAALE